MRYIQSSRSLVTTDSSNHILLNSYRVFSKLIDAERVSPKEKRETNDKGSFPFSIPGICFYIIFRKRAFHVLQQACSRRRFDGLSYFCAYAGRTSPRVGHRAGLPRVRSRQAGTVAEGASEKVHLVLKTGPRSAESTWNPSPAIRRIWVSYIGLYMYLCVLRGSFGVHELKNVAGFPPLGLGWHIAHSGGSRKQFVSFSCSVSFAALVESRACCEEFILDRRSLTVVSPPCLGRHSARRESKKTVLLSIR